MKVVIIGSGIAGMAASVRLAVAGHQVSIYETNGFVGGKLSSFKIGDYRFDAGPSLFTMPHFITELFELAGEQAEDHFQYTKKNIGCKHFWKDGTILNAYADQSAYLKEVEDQLGVPAARLKTYLDRAQLKYELTAPLFLEQSLHKWRGLLRKETWECIKHLSLFEIGQSLHQVNQKQLEESHLVQLYDRFATYNGSNPFQTPGIMTLVQHLEQHYGTFVPKKGMVSISESIAELAKRCGVSIHLNKKVDEILVRQNKAIGIQTGTETVDADLVVSNMDVVPTYRHLLPRQKAPERILKEDRSSSAIIFYWGVKSTFPNLELHNIFFSEDYKAEFEAIFKNQTVPLDPTIYVNITSRDVAGDAPKGCENWFVMINTPCDSGQDWESMVNQLREAVLQHLQFTLKKDLGSLIEEEYIMTPPMIAERTGSHQGALYGSSSNGAMSAFLRHANFSRHIKNLFFCGGSVHPGGGIPLCLLSAKIVTDLIQND
ncbi:MAG: phytoene desaturase family protein [Bacteroidetes bacterium]|nr:phytoene desaturase family protein [Bacteroidota bacterium]MDA0879273.1 phytoene desaturase family protein [Bacteroidota bacterium]MDA1114882.1 phytoene desaturase family protein [Bacteroidota bacterium]